MIEVRIVCDWTDPGGRGILFVEVETPDGRSIALPWHERPDGYLELRVVVPEPL